MRSIKESYFCNKYISTIFERVREFTKDRTHSTFCTITLYSITNFLGRSKTYFMNSILRNKKKNNTMRVLTFSFVIDIAKLFMSLYYIKSAYTDNFLRPLARRRLSTLRPFAVAILALKPCVRFLGVLCGWYVLFI
jgi:hypothetical protein